MKEKNCARCGAPFMCNHGNIAKCQCSTVNLSMKTREYIQMTYTDCLCAKCLKELEQEKGNIK